MPPRVFIIGSGSCQWANDLIECDPGFFPCGNSTECVAQQFQCDDIAHCQNAADESGCAIADGWLAHFDYVHPVSVGETKALNECALAQYPDGCVCSKLTQLDCSEFNLNEVPPNLPENITRLYLKSNNIVNIGSELLANYSSLVYLNLMGNRIHEIAENSFRNLRNLKRLFLSENNISRIQTGAFNGLSGLHWLFLNDNKMRTLEPGIFLGLEGLYWLDMRNNEIRDLQEGEALKDLKSLVWLDFEGNDIRSINARSFAGNTSLTVLILRNNSIESIERDAFTSLGTLVELDLSHNQISHLPEGIFDGLHTLEILRLRNNPLFSLPVDVFRGMKKLVDLDLAEIIIGNINVDMFQGLTRLEKVAFDKFEYCRYAPHVRTCTPRSDGISSFENLLKNVVLRVFVWTIGIITSVGNLGVLVSRAFMKAENKVHTVVVINLCTADFLMGIYLLIIGTHDVKYRDNYNQHALEWTNGITCKVSGLLAMISSEVSVLTLMFISLERYFIIVYPYSFQRIKTRRAIMVLAFIWFFGTLLAVVPIIPVDYFGNFYGSNGVCFPLHLHEPRMRGWEYSVVVFLGINSTAFVAIALSYTGMFLSIRKTRRAAAQCGMKGDMAYAKRFFFVILTDSLCWLPIAVLKVMSLCNFIISETLYGWIIVFVLPINSALNPILYTLSTTSFAMWFMRQLKRGKFKTSGCYIGSNVDMSELRGRIEESGAFTSYTNMPKRASFFLPTRKHHVSSKVEAIPAVSSSVPSRSATTTAMTNNIRPLHTINEGEIVDNNSQSQGNHQLRRTPIVRLCDLME
ncbi:relaxin receptor 2-like [Strongylocentrotus purpuratus]|uniref:G-protein coupled receptors family 1 profile domain-containing protein n=1 Tax=Strongylocentrotus purpuratus TaxID=7668 RepID=A0A7M7NJ04_STRPU|nr:relaxin receptor 2-like [Strongylocentrotus purpuratus]